MNPVKTEKYFYFYNSTIYSNYKNLNHLFLTFPVNIKMI